MKIKRYILIDGENLHYGDYSGIEKLNKNDTVVIFDSKFTGKNINWKLLCDISQKKGNNKPTIVHSNVNRNIHKQEKNKMDCYMMAHIMEFVLQENCLKNKIKNMFKPSKTEYCIISRDKGFNNHVEYFKDIHNTTVFRFDNINNLNNHYNKNNKNNKKVVKKEYSTAKVNNDKNDKSKIISNLSREVEVLKNMIYDLSNKIELNSLNEQNKDNLEYYDINIDSLISKEKISYCNRPILDNESNDIDSKIIYLSNFKNSGNEYGEEISLIEPITLDIKNKSIIYNNKNFDKINLKKFNENYNSYPRKKKLLRDGLFIKNVFKKHNLYDKYSKKSLDKFIRDCDNGLINIRTVTKRLSSSFSKNSIKDFKPALDEIIKYQIKNNIM